MKYDLVSTRQAADMLGVSHMTVLRWTLKDRLPVAAKVNGVTGGFLFDRDDVEKLAQSL